jgi:hypothetical protein
MRCIKLKAARTLGLLSIQIFIAWFPIFILTLTKLNGKDQIKSTISSVFLCLGVVNSAFNPIAYAMTNKEFRKYAFRYRVFIFYVAHA